MKNILLWFKIIRPQTLFASLCPVLVALMVVHLQGYVLHGWVAAATALCALALQVLSNLINDYYDFRRGTDQKGRVGFKRALAEGLVSERQMLTACLITLAIALLLGLYLVLVGGWVILLIGVMAIVFAWLYTATNHSLSYLGIADIFVFLFYGIIAGWGTGYLQVAPQPCPVSLTRTLLWASAVNGLISNCVLIINNLRDRETDLQAGKRTFPVRFGKRAGEVGMALVMLLMPLCAWMAFRQWVPCLIILPAIALLVCTLRATGAQYNKCLLGAGLVNICYVLLVILKI